MPNVLLSAANAIFILFTSVVLNRRISAADVEKRVAKEFVEWFSRRKMAKRRKFINPFKGLNGGSSSALNNGEDNVSIQGNEPNVDSFSNTQSGNAIERQTVRKPNVEKNGDLENDQSGDSGGSSSNQNNCD
ncbi:hypothetical protein ACFE04_021364 [Oxalis oulophora]